MKEAIWWKTGPALRNPDPLSNEWSESNPGPLSDEKCYEYTK